MWRFSSQNILILHIRMCWLKTSLKMSRVNKNGLHCGLNGEHTILWIPIMDDYDHPHVVQPPVESSTTVRGADVLLGQKFNCFFQKGLAPSHQKDTWSTRSDQVPRKKYCKIHAAQIPMVYGCSSVSQLLKAGWGLNIPPVTQKLPAKLDKQQLFE